MPDYGFGTVQNYLVVVRPEPQDHVSDPATGGMASETANANLMWGKYARSPGWPVPIRC
jgi:hypothetical protein